MTTNMAVATFLTAAALTICAQAVVAQDARSVLRVGVFDSRAVALAYGNSDEFLQSVRQMRTELENAKANKDEKRVKELEQEGPCSQIRLHQQVFSTAPISSILTKVKDKIPGIAAQAGVRMVVSKWEVQFSDPAVENVDVTLPLVMLFNPNEKVLKWVEQMKNQAPIAFEELPLDPMM